jgi:hypothetical protein
MTSTIILQGVVVRYLLIRATLKHVLLLCAMLLGDVLWLAVLRAAALLSTIG